MRNRRGADRALVGKSEERRQLGRPRRRWEDNTEMGLREMGWSMFSIDLTEDNDRSRALVNAVMNFRVP
jgi:hypothetical protein